MRWCSFALALALLRCDVRQEKRLEPLSSALPCRSDSDCSSGSCLAAAGICNTPVGALGTILFEITPQSFDGPYGSARAFELVKNLGESSPDVLELNVPQRVDLSGQVDAAPEQAACTKTDQKSLPVLLDFTPREHLLGISVPTYEIETVLDEASGENLFSGSLLPGSYDVYMRRKPALAPPVGCNFAPQVFRDFNVEAPYNFQPQQRSLKLTMPWRDDLEGWSVDVIHPVTGEVISTRVTLRSPPVNPNAAGEPSIQFVLHYSVGGQRDLIQAGDELVRLSPPPGAPAGTVFLQRSGLELVTPGEGTIGDVAAFGAPVEFQAWVWEAERDRAVRGTVDFAATSLAEVEAGIFASFKSSASVDELGQVRVTLLPGDYRVRVVPPADEGLAAAQFSVPVWENVPAQEGHVFRVPGGARALGNIVIDGTEAPLTGVQVSLIPSYPAPGACLRSDPDEPPCEQPQALVLQKALAQDPFVPRSRTALTQGDGSFQVDELDCRLCRPGSGARFDLTVRPPGETGLPWLVAPSLSVDVRLELGTLSMRAPVARPVQVTFGPAPSMESKLPYALVRAYVLLDRDSKPIADPEGLPPCVASGFPTEQRCVQSALQVAEARSDHSGELLLLLPPGLY